MKWLFSLPLTLSALVMSVSPLPAQTSIPPTATVLFEAFADDSLQDWTVAPGSQLAAEAQAAFDGPYGLGVSVSQAESHIVDGGARELSRAEEGYLTFRFNPNTLNYLDPGSGFIPGRSIQIGAIKGPAFKNLVAVRIRDLGSGYEGFVEWRDSSDVGQFDFETPFTIDGGWQEMTIGFRLNEWVACWIDGHLVRSISTGVSHLEPYGAIVEVGKTLTNTLIDPSGTMFFDNIRLHVLQISDLWVDAENGSDASDGLSSQTAFATIGRALSLAAAGTTVHILGGEYRESVTPAHSGSPIQPIVILAEGGPGTATILGSVAGSDLQWTQLQSNTIGLPADVEPTNIWFADLSNLNLSQAPRFIVRRDPDGTVTERFPLAREPDWQVQTAHQPSLQWWEAEGGWQASACDPSTDSDPNCDMNSRSTRQLTDGRDDNSPSGVEPGNLKFFADLTGAGIVALDCYRGHYHYRRRIASHDSVAGRIEVDEDCVRDGGTLDPGLGWGSKYFLEDHPALLDSPGEWWFDPATQTLYLWPTEPGSPGSQGLELSRFETGFDLKDRSYISLKDLDVTLFNESLVSVENWIHHLSLGVALDGLSLSWGNRGLLATHRVEAGTHSDKRIEGLRVDGCSFTDIDFEALRISATWDDGSLADAWTRSGVLDTRITNSDFFRIGYRSEYGADSSAAIAFRHADDLVFTNNTVADIAHNGIHLLESVVQSAQTWGFDASQIKIGAVEIRGNLIDGACQMKNDCGGMRIWGTTPDKHVFRDVLVTENRFVNTIGWGWAAQRRDINSQGAIAGAGGSGFYLDHTTGIHIHRNISYNNGLAGFNVIQTWRDGQLVVTNNIAANNTIGLIFGGLDADTHPNVDFKVINNIVANNEGYGIQLAEADGDLTNTEIDTNLYFANGWGSNLNKPGAFNMVMPGSQQQYQTVDEIRLGTDFETTGQSGDPRFFSYDAADHDPFDQSVPDFRILEGSIATDAGQATLPQSLGDLLNIFGIVEVPQGSAFDQGVYEGETAPLILFSDGFESGDSSFWSATSV